MKTAIAALIALASTLAAQVVPVTPIPARPGKPVPLAITLFTPRYHDGTVWVVDGKTGEIQYILPRQGRCATWVWWLEEDGEQYRLHGGPSAKAGLPVLAVWDVPRWTVQTNLVLVVDPM